MGFDIFDLQIEEPKVNINDYTWTFYGKSFATLLSN